MKTNIFSRVHRNCEGKQGKAADTCEGMSEPSAAKLAKCANKSTRMQTERTGCTVKIMLLDDVSHFCCKVCTSACTSSTSACTSMHEKYCDISSHSLHRHATVHTRCAYFNISVHICHQHALLDIIVHIQHQCAYLTSAYNILPKHA